MWISYADSEVSKYHPVCEDALNAALVLLEKAREYRVLHHQRAGTLEMDFVIQNRSTGKYLCVVEVKRTPADVHSTRYQYQAMSYVQMNEGLSEKPFYILTNLECAFCFRYDAARPRASQQMLAPDLHSIGLFSRHQRPEFVSRLTNFFAEQISNYLQNQYEYSVTLEHFREHMGQLLASPRAWKSNLAALLYEYIRGAFSFVERDGLHDIRLFQNNVSRICNEASRINFKEIFDYSPDRFEGTVSIDSAALASMYAFGRRSVTGDSIANILHQIVSDGHEHEGEVPTDLELGRMVAQLAYSVSGGLPPGKCICDPAAGSGNLISSAIEVFSLGPGQIKANDINKRLLELLSLRLGLNYANSISTASSPRITAVDAAELPEEYFKDIDIVVLNPPFLAGINAVERKRPFFGRINSLTGGEAITNMGQMPLEAVFLELIIHLSAPGTTIACVFPKTHLLARGPEAQAIRKLLIDKLGLRVIFTYPGKDIFSGVTKDTCVLVGKAKEPSARVDIISSYDSIPDLDLHGFAGALKLDFTEAFRPVAPGIVAKAVPARALAESIPNGWRDINSEMAEAIAFVEETFKLSDDFRPIEECRYKIKRGRAGNSGGSDLLFAAPEKGLAGIAGAGQAAFKPGLRNAELDCFVADNGDSLFLDVSTLDDHTVNTAVKSYLALPARQGRQAREVKTLEQWKEILQRESRGGFSACSVLIPRALRRKGRVHLARRDIFVSTNFVVCYDLPHDDAVFLSTWFSTIFYQLICEVSSKDQEGMRKMEVRDVSKTFVPKREKIGAATIDSLKKICEAIEFVDLQNPRIREVDRLWAAALFGARAEEMLNEACSLLSYLGTRRNG